ncbi:MAG: 50S ribosomal protein L9 [Lachnospiraceae bacterium]|nr:50S ribosomal protein L9 [Lachnospiraceae bacterium]
MQIILLQDVKGQGKKDDIIKISDGYARNFILPKKLGVEATEKNLKELEQRKAEEAQREKELYEEAADFGRKLDSAKIALEIKGGEGGRTFGSITAKEIAAGIKDQLGYDIDKKKLVLSDAIKNAGEFTVGIKLHPKVTANLKVVVAVV